MRQKVYSVFDEKAMAYLQPFYFNHHGEALRSFERIVKTADTMVANHPSDFKLYHIGEFDNVSGKLSALNEPFFLANASDYVKSSGQMEMDFNSKAKKPVKKEVVQ